MNSILYHNLSEILGIEQLKKLTMKLEMVRFFVSTTLKHVQIGKSKDKQAFSSFKKNVNVYAIGTRQFYELFE